MNRMLLIWAAGGLTLGASLASAASLDVRTGLWEVTSQGETTGMPPIPPETLARMTPEQRAQMMAAMTSKQPEVSRSCITDKTLQHGFDMSERERADCTRTVSNSTSRQVDVRIQCTGQQTMNGRFHIEANDRQTISGNLDFVVSSGPNTMTMKRTLRGKWISSDCGNVKPREE